MYSRIINVVKLIVILLFFFFLNDFIYAVSGIKPDDLSLMQSSLLMCMIDIILCLLIGIFYKDYLVDDFKKFINSINKGRLSIKYVCMLFATKLGTEWVCNILYAIFGITSAINENQQSIEALTFASPWLMLISASLFAPFIEEGIFRLGFRKLIDNRYAFIFISGLVFGLIHVFPTDINVTEALITSIPYIAVGIVFAWIYDKENNIFYSIIVHAINNFLAMMVLLALYFLENAV